MSISSYEDGGLERVFSAILRAKNWGTRLPGGFRHFQKPIDFDSSLVRHILPDDRIRCLWWSFETFSPRQFLGWRLDAVDLMEQKR
jgi:hypothetical protein